MFAFVIAVTLFSASALGMTDFKSHDNYQLLPTLCGREVRKNLEVNKTVGMVTTPVSIQHRIVGGKLAKEGAYPWMALLFVTSMKDVLKKPYQKCGGSLISSRYVLTAAHCLKDEEPLAFVRLGEHDLRVKKCMGNCSEDVKVEKIITHKKFSFTTLKNDIALLRLARDVLPTDNFKIAPICLPIDVKADASEGSKFLIAGWGKTSHYDDKGSPQLRQALLRSNGECSSCLKGLAPSDPFCPLSRKLQICVQTDRAKDPCFGDSGGPLMMQVDDYLVLAGIISLKFGVCGQTMTPVVYTRVDGYLKWILDHVEPSETRQRQLLLPPAHSSQTSFQTTLPLAFLLLKTTPVSSSSPILLLNALLPYVCLLIVNL